MSNIDKKQDRRWDLCYEGKVFVIGAITGAVLLSGWNYIYERERYGNLKLSDDAIISQLKVDSDHMLINYVDGRWESSLKDLILNIHIDSKLGTITVEMNDEQPRHFNIVKIKDVNGVFGVLTLDLCLVGQECTDDEYTSIQINKVFGVDKAITVTYDPKFAKCAEKTEDKCVKGFRRH